MDDAIIIWLIVLKVMVAICDAIKQKKSELEKIITQFSVSLYATHSELYHAENPVTIEHMVPEI